MIMFWAVCILFLFIVSLIGCLIVAMSPASKEVKSNASILIEELQNNRLTNCRGDVAFCYRLHLPELYSLPEEDYDRVNEVWRIALKDLPQGTIILRSDRYDRRPFDASQMPENSYIRREEKRYAAGRETTTDRSYLFVIFTGFRTARASRNGNPFRRVTHGEVRTEDLAYGRFTAAVDSMYQQLAGSGLLTIEPMCPEEIEDQARRLDKAREELSDDLDAMLVRGHTNVVFWADSEQQLKEHRSRITNYLKQVRDFEPVVPSGAELRNVVYCSHPATVACMDRDSCYLVDIRQAIALFQSTGGYRSDNEGIYYSDPIHHLPLRYDLYDAHKRYVDSRNIAVIGRTGGGKTVNLEKVVEGYHNDPEKEYVNIIIDCGGSYDKAARLYDSEEVFIFRYNPEESMGLDPFAVGTVIDSERIDDICETLWLIIKPGAEPLAEERVSLRKIVLSYLQIAAEPAWPDFYAWVRDNYQQILADNEIRESYFNAGQFVHNGSEWCDGGLFGNVLARSDDPTARLGGKKLLIFELENIRTKPQLLSIVVHLIGIAIRTLVWEQPGRRGFIIYEEFAELMKIEVIFSAVLYQMQAIRKKGGSACIVLQNLDQLALNAGDRYRNEGGAAGALMKNIETVIFLAGADPTGFERYAPGFSAHDRRCVQALKNNYTVPPMYSSFYIFRSKKSTLMSLCVSPRTFLAFQTEGEICDELGRLYAETGLMEQAIERYEQTHKL